MLDFGNEQTVVHDSKVHQELAIFDQLLYYFFLKTLFSIDHFFIIDEIEFFQHFRRFVYFVIIIIEGDIDLIIFSDFSQ